ncbi:hypothetical protein [Lentzea flaviverrucosa]|uniref:hypothetical protein n=1 Tax=Lentzea flaviverrucosa TaxID=200379 RepID=UPI0011601A00|nr:hypothetical protein [Lentzea flaviverrucosa]
MTDALHLAYAALRTGWRDTLQDRRSGENAPGFERVIGAEDAPITDKELLLQGAELMAVDASKSVLHHLRSLTKMYRADGGPGAELDQDEWPGTGAYSVARAVLEGTAMVAWLMAPDIDLDERVLRASLVGLWSAKEDRRPPSADPDVWTEEDWKKAVTSCGLEVKEAGYKLGVKVDGKVRTFGQSSVIRETLGQSGSALYAEWSGVAHHAAWAVGNLSAYQIAEDGRGFRSHTKRGYKRHLGMAAEVAEVLVQAGEAMAGYWARDCDDLSAVCLEMAARMRDCASQLPDD